MMGWMSRREWQTIQARQVECSVREAVPVSQSSVTLLSSRSAGIIQVQMIGHETIGITRVQTCDLWLAKGNNEGGSARLEIGKADDDGGRDEPRLNEAVMIDTSV